MAVDFVCCFCGSDRLEAQFCPVSGVPIAYSCLECGGTTPRDLWKWIHRRRMDDAAINALMSIQERDGLSDEHFLLMLAVYHIDMAERMQAKVLELMTTGLPPIIFKPKDDAAEAALRAHLEVP